MLYDYYSYKIANNSLPNLDNTIYITYITRYLGNDLKFVEFIQSDRTEHNVIKI